MGVSRRALAGGSALVLSTGLIVGGSTAQAERLPAPPRVNVVVTEDGVRMPDMLRSQRYRFVVRTPRRIGVELLLIKPDRGYTKAEFARDGRAANRGSVAAIRRITKNARFFGGTTADADHNGVFWETLYAGRYWALNFAGPTRAGQIHTLRVRGPEHATRWPGEDTRVATLDFGFRGPKVLPRHGKMLIRNRMGAQPHFVIFARLPKGTSYREVVAYLHNPQGPPPRIQEVMYTPIMSGDVQYLKRYRLRQGTYALLCFFPNTRMGPNQGNPHAFMGMHRKVRVR